MPYVQMQKSNIRERDGLIQIQLSMYLLPEDYGYERCRSLVTVYPQYGYPGELDKEGFAVDAQEFERWTAGLPREWQTGAFHHHFIRVAPDTSDVEIMDIAEAFLHEAYIKWAQDLFPDLTNQALCHEPDREGCAARIKSLQDNPPDARTV